MDDSDRIKIKLNNMQKNLILKRSLPGCPRGRILQKRDVLTYIWFAWSGETGMPVEPTLSTFNPELGNLVSELVDIYLILFFPLHSIILIRDIPSE
jgi:hypothetical protein